MSANLETAAPTGRSVPTEGKERSDAALGHASQNTSSPVGAKKGGLFDLRGIVQPRSGKSSPATHPDLPYIGLEHVEAHTTRLLGSVPATEMKSPANRFQPGDVLYSRLRPYLNKVWRADRDGLCSSEFIVLPGNERIDAAYLCYRLNSRDFVSFANSLNAGDRPRVDFEQISEFKTWVPDTLSEQRRIVAEIEKQFTRLEAGVAALRLVQANLKRYRAAVLKAACEGRLVPTEAALARSPRSTKSGPPAYETGEALLARILTERRRNWQGRGQYKEPTVIDAANQSPLPFGWTWASMRQVGEVQLGRQRAPQHHAGDNMRPYLRVANVLEARIDISDVKEMNFTPVEFERYRLRHGDILLNEGQTPEHVGRPAMFRNEIPDCCYQKTLLRFRAYAGVLPQFALIVFRAYMHNQRFTREASITTNIAHLTAEKFVEIEFPLPPLAEQMRIVAEVERRLSVVEELESVVTANLQRATRLRQSILQMAFTGALT